MEPGRDEDDTLLPLAQALREAAGRAGRADVVAKADEVIALLGPVRETRGDRGNAVLRFLDGLGF